MKIKIIILLLFTLVSCDSVKKGLGMTKNAPNEFLIEKRDPLVMPPDYKILPPDSKSAAKEAQSENNSIQSLIDKSITSNEKSKQSTVSDLEKEVLNQIK
jgi:hypothetical protein